MELALLACIAVLQLVTVALLVPIRSRRVGWLDVSAKERGGELPGGRWEIVGGLGGDPILPSGALVLEVRSRTVWVHEVWVRTDHGWVQLQPGPGGGTFRNALVSGLRLSTIRLWLAPAGQSADETDLQSASGLLVPAALLLTRAGRPTPSPSPSLRANTPPPSA